MSEVTKRGSSGDQSDGFPADVDGAVSVHCLLTDRATDPLFVESARLLALNRERSGQ